MRNTKFKVGDTVVCTGQKNKGAYKGGGWREGWTFTINKVTDASLPKNNNVYWGNTVTGGIYEPWLRISYNGEQLSNTSLQESIDKEVERLT